MFALVKPFLIACSIIIFLLFAIGMIRIEKSDYGCFKGKKLRFDDKVTVIDVGSFKLYAYPLVSDCPEEDRYNPETVYKCGYQTFCQRDGSDGSE